MSDASPTTNPLLPSAYVTFESLTEGLDYAARGETGCNFYMASGELGERLSYAELRERAVGAEEGETQGAETQRA